MKSKGYAKKRPRFFAVFKLWWEKMKVKMAQWENFTPKDVGRG
jgi:hypothetical protein